MGGTAHVEVTQEDREEAARRSIGLGYSSHWHRECRRGYHDYWTLVQNVAKERIQRSQA